jgi:divinyl chlorophyllide a 8-vinyl-reductase
VCQREWIHAGDEVWPEGEFDAVISCIASRSGAPLDAWQIDYFANLRLLALARQRQASRFLLLSAICVQKPRLVFQREKLRFETALLNSGVPCTIVRPTAFFKSLAGQVARIKAGKPFLLFGDGTLTACKPIAAGDLATFMVDRLLDGDAAGQILPIGGPGPAITPRQQAELMFQAFDRNTGTRSVSPRLFDLLRVGMAPLAWTGDWVTDRQEYMHIAKYYATESMLVWDADAGAYDADATPETGCETLAEFYAALRDGRETADLGAAALFG